MKPKIIANSKCVIGEGPIWNPLDQMLYWCDIQEAKIYRFNPSTKNYEEFFQRDGYIGGFTIQKNGNLLLFMEHGKIAELHNGKLNYIIKSIPGEENNRFNDVIAAPKGRVLCGTMSINTANCDKNGTLYILETNGSIKPIIENLSISNGMGFNQKENLLYHTASLDKTIYQYNYSVSNGSISNKTVFAKTNHPESLPDGMTVDSEDNIWSANWDGSSLHKYEPNGEKVLEVNLPVKKVSSLTFGGKNYSDIFVTTATNGNLQEEEGEGAGGVFQITSKTKGKPEYLSNILS